MRSQSASFASNWDDTRIVPRPTSAAAWFAATPVRNVEPISEQVPTVSDPDEPEDADEIGILPLPTQDYFVNFDQQNKSSNVMNNSIFI